jgi:iron complex outermembrane recepter protein
MRLFVALCCFAVPFKISSLAAEESPPEASGHANSAEVETALASRDGGKQEYRLSEVEVFSQRTSALTQAPTESPLEALQPQSTVDLQTISNTVAPSADYTMIANLTPGVSSVQSNGPGLNEAKNILRGFSDGQYNITFDGIPFGDTNSFTHHSTSYFPAKVLGRVTVDRGPGTASTVGEATFGGTIALESKDPRPDPAFIPTFSYGSFNTSVSHLEGNTGLLSSLNGASAIASYQYLNSDGFLTHSYLRRSTTYLKYLQPIGRESTLTFLSAYNYIVFGAPNAVTQAQINQFGRNFGLVSDPTSPLSPLYNYQVKRADFEYIGLDAKLTESWGLNNKVFTYYYANNQFLSPKIGTTYSSTNMGGIHQLNLFRAWGDTLLVSHEDAIGTLKTGAWLEYQRNPRYQYNIDYTLGDVIDVNPANPKATLYAATVYNMVDWLKTVQPFVEYEWRPVPRLTIDGGVKYARFHRDIEAPVNQTTRLSLNGAYTFTGTTPSLSVNYRLTPNWSAYATVAKGFLAPNLQLFYVVDPSRNRISPQTTMNYQVGSVFKAARLNADIDAYWIDYKNLPLTITDGVTSQQYYATASGAYYSGVEGEATVSLGNGFSLFGNGSLSRAVYKKSKLDIPSVPSSTAAAGVVWSRGEFFASLSDKYVGPQKIYASGVNPDIASTLGANVISPGYWLADFALGYSHKFEHPGVIKSYKIKLQFDNVLDRKVQVVSSISAKALASYNVLPGSNAYFTISGEF